MGKSKSYGTNISEYECFPTYHKWKLDILEPTIESLIDDLSCYYAMTDLRDYHTYNLIIAEVISKAILTMREIIILSAYGLPHGILPLARRIYEQYIILAYFELKKGTDDFPFMVKNYFFDSNVQTLKIAQRDNRFHNNPDYAAKIAAREEEIKSQAEYDNIKSDYWWCKKHSFSELQKEIMDSAKDDKAFRLFLHDFDMMYTISNKFLHANAYGTMSRLDHSIDTSTDIDCNPEIEGHSTGLCFAVGSLLGICNILHINSSFDTSKYDDVLGKLFAFYREEMGNEQQKLCLGT